VATTSNYSRDSDGSGKNKGGHGDDKWIAQTWLCQKPYTPTAPSIDNRHDRPVVQKPSTDIVLQEDSRGIQLRQNEKQADTKYFTLFALIVAKCFDVNKRPSTRVWLDHHCGMHSNICSF
jgi:hypothetical protein